MKKQFRVSLTVEGEHEIVVSAVDEQAALDLAMEIDLMNWTYHESGNTGIFVEEVLHGGDANE